MPPFGLGGRLAVCRSGSRFAVVNQDGDLLIAGPTAWDRNQLAARCHPGRMVFHTRLPDPRAQPNRRFGKCRAGKR
jgi:hypothetical protein